MLFITIQTENLERNKNEYKKNQKQILQQREKNVKKYYRYVDIRV